MRWEIRSFAPAADRQSVERLWAAAMPPAWPLLPAAVGKTTIADAAYLAHSKTFPRLPRPSAAGLGEPVLDTAKTVAANEHSDSFRLVYLPAWRNPVDELARREARILIELLRAQQQNLGRGRNQPKHRSYRRRRFIYTL